MDITVDDLAYCETHQENFVIGDSCHQCQQESEAAFDAMFQGVISGLCGLSIYKREVGK